MKKIGFLINPVAGMGGAVGLKGTDGKREEATVRGAVPQAINRAKITLNALKNNKNLMFLAPSGEMGEDALKETLLEPVQVISYPEKKAPPGIQRLQHSGFLKRVLI